MTCHLVGVSLALPGGRACYIPLGHRAGPDDLFGGAELVAGQIAMHDAIARLKPLFEDASVLKIAHNMKYDLTVLGGCGITVAPIEDTMLISYALDSGRNNHGLDELAQKHLGHKNIAFGEVAGTGKNFIGFARVAIDKATEYAAEDADVCLRLWRVLKPRLAAESATTVYETLERPMVATLHAMELRGVAIDRTILARLSGEFAQTMARLEDEIYEAAGERFNLGSPKQLGDILFGKMGLPGAKKTATGQWSTSASVLEDLAEEGNGFARLILEWRQLSKLKSTYADSLPGFVNAKTGRVHTSFALAATSTGRLSSSDPNLQNIPVRNEIGRKIRAAFVAPPGRVLISADYSQIELRLLAHVADIPQLKKAFAEGLDIHAMTASEMFGVPIEGMPSEVRRRAKAINFGIIYGISAFGLANQLGIPREEAALYIRTYFERFPGIRDYMDAMKKTVREKGVVTTIFGRKCHFPRIGSANASERAFFERQAINAPIQGAAADIIRRAMVRMDAALLEAGLSAQMLLQVHDELVFEAPEAEAEKTIEVVKRVMVEAPHPRGLSRRAAEGRRARGAQLGRGALGALSALLSSPPPPPCGKAPRRAQARKARHRRSRHSCDRRRSRLPTHSLAARHRVFENRAQRQLRQRDLMLAAAIDQRRRRLAGDDVDARADERKALARQIDDERRDGKLSREPGFYDMPVACDDIDRLIGDLSAAKGGDERVDARVGLAGGNPQAIEPNAQRHRRGESRDDEARPSARLAARRSLARRVRRCERADAVAQPRRRALGLDFFAHRAAQRDDGRIALGELGLIGEPRLQRERARRIELAVGERIDEQRVLVVAHDFCSKAARSSARARASRDITVPMGAPVASPISR